MPREDRPMKHLTVRIFEEDYEFLRQAFGGTTGYNKVVRHVIHKLVKSLQENQADIHNIKID